MRFFGRDRRTPTDEQRKRLSRIGNPAQRRALLAAIQRGETIPDYAWTPLPEEHNPALSRLYEQIVQHAKSSGRDMSEVIASLTPDTHIQFYADRARETASEDTGYLCVTPVRVADLVTNADKASGILGWGIFNPYGPTFGLLARIEVPERPESLLYLTRMNPFQCENFVYGIFPDSIRQEYLNDILGELFSQYPTGEFGLFCDSLPSFIAPLAPRLEFSDLVHKGLAHIGPEKVKRECILLRRIPNDPWGIATEQLRLAFPARRDEARSSAVRESADAGALDQWLSLVTEKDHLISYMKQMPHAWEGAIEHEPTQQFKVMDWVSAERILRKLWL